MQTLQSWLDDYGRSHRNPVNKRLHWLCIPPIVLAALGGFRALPFGDALLNGGTLAALLAVVYYGLLSWRLALGMALVFAGMVWLVDASYAALGARDHLVLMTAIFVLAWIGQFVGHKFEGAKPSFFKDVQFLLIGPLWLLADIYRRLEWPLGGRRLART